jgi:ferritin-like metal-binding protein YciE
VLDVAIIAAAQRIEHYEIAAYGTVAALAEAMGQEEIKNLLTETLNEEKQTDELLTNVSQQVNADALSDSDEDEDEGEDEAEEAEGKPAPKKAAAKKSAKK